MGKRGWRSMGAAGDAPCAVRSRREAQPGAIVIGGDYQGLGIVRSLGRRGVDVVVVDDEHSISRHSRYLRSGFRFRDLRDDRATLRVLLELGRSGEFAGWVVYPTREETVATLSRHRARAARVFPDPHAGMGGHEVGMGQAQHLSACPGARDPHTANVEGQQRGRVVHRATASRRSWSSPRSKSILLCHGVQGVASQQPGGTRASGSVRLQRSSEARRSSSRSSFPAVASASSPIARFSRTASRARAWWRSAFGSIPSSSGGPAHSCARRRCRAWRRCQRRS